MKVDTVEKFLIDLNEKDFIQPNNLFNSRKYKFEDEEDLLCTFFSYLQSKCLIRFSPNPLVSNNFKLSKVGKEIIEDKDKRIVFVEEFLKFYGMSVDY